MAFEFKLPDLGEGVAEGEIVKWLVKEGDTVQEDQAIVEVMTDKATVEIPSPVGGTVEKILAKEGKVVPVGSILVKMKEGSAKAAGNGKGAAKTDTPLFSASPAPKRAPAAAAPAPSSASSSERVLASPATRRMAREMGVNLGQVRGSGPQGRVTRDDLSGGAAAMTTTPTPALRPMAQPRRDYKPSGGEERIPLRGIRKKIAEHMVKSKHTAMHFTQVDEVDMTELVALRAKAKESADAQGVKVTYLSFIIRAVCMTLRDFPMMNASLDDEKSEIVVKHYYNIGVAVDTKDGLVVPVVKNADQKMILELAADIETLAEKARAGKLALDDIHGGTFTITSTGGNGGLLATPIINHPEVAILGVHRIREAPVVRNGQIVIRQMGHISLSLDHRIVDGATGASFLRQLIQYLEDPKLLLLHA